MVGAAQTSQARYSLLDVEGGTSCSDVIDQGHEVLCSVSVLAAHEADRGAIGGSLGHLEIV